MQDNNIVFIVFLLVLKETKKRSWSHLPKLLPGLLGLPYSMAVRFQKSVFQETFSLGSSLETGTTFLALYSVCQSSHRIHPDSRRRNITLLLNGMYIQECVAIFIHHYICGHRNLSKFSEIYGPSF